MPIWRCTILIPPMAWAMATPIGRCRPPACWAGWMIWLAALLHSAVRPVAQAWREQLSAGAILCMLLPLLNAATTGQHLAGYLAQGDIERAAVELTAIVLGFLLAFAALRAGPRKAVAATSIRRAA